MLGWDVLVTPRWAGEERLGDVNAFSAPAACDPDAAFEILRRYHVTHLIVGELEESVHPVVLARLKPLATFPDVTLYAVPGA